jgi:DNA polymerase-3 subunit epsilon
MADRDEHVKIYIRFRPGPVFHGSVGVTWPRQLIHFIDFEGSVASGILEYGVVSLLGNEIVATTTRTCRPNGRVRPEDIAVHGLDPANLTDCSPFTDEFARFAALRATGPLAAHFAQAENSLLKSVWPYSRAAPDFSRETPAMTDAATDWGPWIDTGRLYPQVRAADAPVKLAALVAAEGLQKDLDALAGVHCPPARHHYHAALYDALAGALLLARLGATPGWGDRSLRWLLEHSTLDPARREALRQEELF